MKREIIDVWNDNSDEWIKLMNEDIIPSRKVTDRAIEETILQHDFDKICDIGCGEGWLVRRLRELGRAANGVDAARRLIVRAKAFDEGSCAVQTFQQISHGELLAFGPYDAAVLNLCIYEQESTANLLSEVVSQLQGSRLLFIQSLHPLSISKFRKPYQDQWMDDTWKGLDGNFTSTHSWYYRTFSGWTKLFNDVSLKVLHAAEPLSSTRSEPPSIIFTLTKYQDND